MQINLLAFGQIAEITGKSAWIMTAVKDTNTLKINLEQEFPLLSATSYSLAINKKILQKNTVLNQGDTIALLPPFSGG